MPRASATAAAIAASASRHALGAAAMLGPIGISQSSRKAWTLITLAPFRAAWRMRCANSG